MILIILATVSINAVMGENGLIKQAEKASKMYANSIASEGDAIDSLLQQLGTGNGSGQGGKQDQDIIITSKVNTRGEEKYIDLSFQLEGLPATMEEYIVEYANGNLLEFIEHNILPEYTNEQLEQICIENIQGAVVNGEISDEFKGMAISQISTMINEALGMEEDGITLPFEQSLRIYMYTQISGGNISDLADTLLNGAMIDMQYSGFCDIIGVEPYYTAEELEQQSVELHKRYIDSTFNGTFDDVLAIENMTKQDLENMAALQGITYELMLKMSILETGSFLVNINVTVSNGDNFVVQPLQVYSYKVTEEGTYTFTAELQDGSGRRGEITVNTEESDNPYDPAGWEVAWVYDDGEWSDIIQKGETAEGDIVAKFYKTENTIKPNHPNFGEDFVEEGPAYTMVLEGKGDMGNLYEENGDTDIVISGYYKATPTGMMQSMLLGKPLYEGIPYPVYVTEVYICDGITSIGDLAFMEFVSMESIRIPETVKSIGKSAFNDCVSLAEIEIPDSVISIEELAFVTCISLTSLTIPEGVTTISDEAFSNCEGLKSITIPSSVSTIGSKAFFGCTSLESVVIPEGVLYMPGDEEHPTTGGAFDWCTNLKSITLPASLTSVTSWRDIKINENVVIYVAKGFNTTLKNELISYGYNVVQL